jgi:hypothetical protein
MQWHALFFSVKATIDGHIVSIPAETAKEAFAEAIDRQVAKEIMMSLSATVATIIRSAKMAL